MHSGNQLVLMSEAATSLPQIVGGGFLQTALQLLCIAAPFAGIAMLLHWLERVSQRPLARRFGWRSVLWTGWLGTPIHELSHAAMCLVFFHRIDEVALFRPDKEAGRLGFVRHSYNPKNPYQVVGNFFIGLAPLAGGTLVLYGMLWFFYPGAAKEAFVADGLSTAIATGQVLDVIRNFTRLAGEVIFNVVSLPNPLTLKFWLFLYLVLCVGSHMAPSSSDYKGAFWGGALLLVLLLAVNIIFLAAGGEPGALLRGAAPWFGPALALFAFCAVLCSFVALLLAGIGKLIRMMWG